MKRTQRVAPLPTRDGVGPSVVVLPEGPWSTIAEFLIARFGAVPADEWRARIDAHDVVDEHGTPVTPQRFHQPGLRVYYYRAVAAETPVPFEEEVLFQDDWLVAVDKPHFLTVTPTGRYVQQSLLVRLKRRLGIDTLSPIHRIDRETAGVVVFCVQPETRGKYQELFAQRRVHKRYEAVAPWHDLPMPTTRASRLVDHTNGLQMVEVPGEPNAQTRFELLEVKGNKARYGLQPVTGRKHQLRVHCAALGLPIYNDLIYPRLAPAGSDNFDQPLQLLSKSLAFTDPLTGVERCFESRRTLLPL